MLHLNGTSQHSSTNEVKVERTALPWTDPILLGFHYDVSVRACGNGVWGDWSKPRRIRL